MLKKTVLLLLCAVMVVSLFTACASDKADKKPIVYNMGATPKTIDPQLTVQLRRAV